MRGGGCQVNALCQIVCAPGPCAKSLPATLCHYVAFAGNRFNELNTINDNCKIAPGPGTQASISMDFLGSHCFLEVFVLFRSWRTRTHSHGPGTPALINGSRQPRMHEGVRDRRPWNPTPAFNKQLTARYHTHSLCTSKTHDAQAYSLWPCRQSAVSDWRAPALQHCYPQHLVKGSSTRWG